MLNDPDGEVFISARIKKKLKKNKSQLVEKEDSFTIGILGTRIEVWGSEIKDFVRHYEAKLREYLSKPFLTVLVDGELLRSAKNFRKYTLGAAICKHYGCDVRRFIEVQFHYHDEWKGSAPSLQYLTSLRSDWNSVDRYKKYCEKFKDDLNYFGEGKDNVNAACQSTQKIKNLDFPKPSLVKIYEDMISFQMEAGKKTRKEILYILGVPSNPTLPFKYLRTLHLYRELVAEDAWGEGPYKFDFYQKLKYEIENK